jgi:hypothetical protein
MAGIMEYGSSIATEYKLKARPACSGGITATKRVMHDAIVKNRPIPLAIRIKARGSIEVENW